MSAPRTSAISRDRLPPSFVQTVLETYGTDGVRWLDALPTLAAACERRFGVRITGISPELSYNLVIWADGAGGAPAVLKLSVRDDESRAEAGALAAYDGAAAVRLLDHWPEERALLLERVRPGAALARLATDDRGAMEIMATLAPELWVPVPAGFAGPRVQDWARGFDRMRERFGGGTGPLPAALVERAERTFAELFAAAPEPRLIHGDLHYGNVLAASRRPWLAIDPKGLVAEPACDAGYLLANHPSRRLPGDGPRPAARVLADRIAFLPGALGLDRQRVVAYAFALSVLNAWWTLEDHGAGWERQMAVGEALVGYLGD